jgi:hypothetical protein
LLTRLLLWEDYLFLFADPGVAFFSASSTDFLFLGPDRTSGSAAFFFAGVAAALLCKRQSSRTPPHSFPSRRIFFSLKLFHDHGRKQLEPRFEVLRRAALYEPIEAEVLFPSHQPPHNTLTQLFRISNLSSSQRPYDSACVMQT